MTALDSDRLDLRFALLYVKEPDTQSLTLKGANRIELGTPASPFYVPLYEAPAPGTFAWPMARVMRTCEDEIVEALVDKFDVRATIKSRTPPRRGIVLPLRQAGEHEAAGVFIVGLSPRLAHDDAYLSFLHLVANQVGAAIDGARSYQRTRERAEKLAELDRAKSVFYSNISHEFRTPLTLVLAPLEDLLGERHGPLAGAQRETLETMRRNAVRLQRLVNGLLDFSRIEAGHMEPALEPTDLVDLTRELVSAFELAIRQAGLKVVVDLAPLPQPVYVDREMWEKVVGNLLSNALKYTEKGKIVVSLRPLDGRVQLTVRDTGIGIASADLPHIFERFYRAGGGLGRSLEGAGIGLALVDELVRLHGGTCSASSTPDEGTTITVELPFGSPAKAAGLEAVAPARQPRLLAALPWVEEARGWIADRAVATRAAEAAATAQPTKGAPATDAATAEAATRARILIAEDNPDMRRYLTELLAPHYDIESVSDGQSALAAARARPPDLLLSDVLMPGLDGFGLLRRLRDDPQTRTVPVVMLSAQAGEEAMLEGLGEGADDYLSKPFSARDLLARVRTHLLLARMRREAAESLMKDTFISVASHELRTPLTVLKLGIQALRKQHGTPGSLLGERLADLERSIKRMNVLVDDMLSVSAIKSGHLTLQREPNDLVAICQTAAQQVGLATNLPIAVDVPGERVEAVVDEGRILQVVGNLLSNARKYSAPNRPVMLSLRRDGDEAHLMVRDQGPGIPPDQMPHLFERFHRVPNIKVQTGSQSGLGLGLYISKAIVDLHQGRIWCESEEGSGSTFHVSLPLKPPPSVAPAQKAAAEPATRKSDG
jgi:signal transduction histidine kinase